jgi:hypothetical protein
MTTIDQIQDYFEDLCTKHIDLLHNVDGRKAYARLRTEDAITQIKKKSTPNIVVISEVNGQRTGSVDDNELRWGISIIFASRALTVGNLGTAVDNAINKAAEIMFDFIAHMQMDMLEDCPMQSLEVEKVTWQDIDAPWLDHFYGWILFVPFRTDMPVFNPEHWTDTASGVPVDDPAPIYIAANFVAEFRVGAPGAPMVDGDTEYSNDLLINHDFEVLANGIKISKLDDHADERYVTKDHESDTIIFHGPVEDNEVITVYRN